MKKIYILLYLVTSIASTLCMETHYNSNEQEIPLVPVYRTNNGMQTTKQVIKIETQPDPILMQKLHSDTCDLFKTFYVSKTIDLVTAMNDAKNKNIHEDVMGKFSYDKWNKTHERDHSKAIIFFGYLKHYNLTVNKTKECLPSINDVIKLQTTEKNHNTPNKLAMILGITVDSNKKQTTSCYKYDTHLTRRTYPAFHRLKCDVTDLSDYYYYTPKDSFLNYIYTHKEIQTNEYLRFSYIDLKKQFYDKVYSFLAKDRINYDKEPSHLYSLIQIIEAGKTLIPAKQESDFEYDFVNFPQTGIAQSLVMINMDNTLTIRQRMGILCRLIKQYNDQRTTKITPTNEQVAAYEKNPSDFALPDSFDSALFDRKIYAFTELQKLTSNIEVLILSDDTYKQECINVLYPQKK